MEQLVHQSYAIALAALIPLLLLLLKSKAASPPHTKPHAGLRLPPGPPTLPVIGSVHLFLTSLPHRAMRDLSRRHGALMLLRLGEVPTVVVSSAEAADEALRTHGAAFASRPVTVTTDILTYGAKNVGFAPYGEHWRQLRRVYVQELMSPKRVQSFRFVREEEVARLVAAIASAAASRRPVNLTKRFYTLTNDVAVRAAIGHRCAHRDAYLQEMVEVLRLMGGFSLADLFPSSAIALRLSPSTYTARRCHRRIHRIFESIIEERKCKAAAAGEEQNLLDVMLRLQREGGLEFQLTDEIISAALVDIFLAGTETTEATMQWAMSELMKQPLAMHKAQSEVRKALRGKATVTDEDLTGLHYLRQVIKETLRLHPAAPLINRECRETTRIMGYDIPGGFTVLVNAWAIGRDPRHWAAAEEFSPERFDGATGDYKDADIKYVPFGAGRRTCPGASFGLANIELALASLLFHFDWELPSGVTPETLDMTEAFGFSAPRKHDLLLHAVPYVPKGNCNLGGKDI